MSKLLVRSRPGPHRGELSGAFPDDHVFGLMEDYERHVAHYGDDSRWLDSHVIIHVTNLAQVTGAQYAAPVVVADTIYYNSKAHINLDTVAVTPQQQTDLATIRKMSCTTAELLASGAVTLRSAP